MSEAIAHRGPDDCGLYAPGDTGIALGHRRLSIIDTSTAGHQPMVSPSGRWIVVFNGEIYNAEDLRARCDSSTAFRGHSDTEVLCSLIDRVGPRAAAEQAIGMFAFAAWDTVERTLVLVRDRLGIKPLYLASTSGTIGFSSELSALRGVSDLVGPVSRSGLAGLLRLGYIPSPSTILDGVEKIEPGTIVEARVEGDRVVCSRQTWWSASQCHSNASDPGLGDIEAVDQLESLIETAVRDRLVSDRPLGAFLSGGIDSSTVVAFMSKLSSSPINTFTIGFEDAEYDEAQHARRVAEHFGTRHTELYIREQDALDIVPELGSMFDEPFADSSQIPMALISRLARRDVVVCLSGDGGDELFAGYDRYAWTMRLWNRMRFVPGVLRRAGGFGLGALPRPVSESLGRLANRCVPNSIRVRNPADKVQRLAEALRQPDSMSLYQDMVGHWKDPTRLLIDVDPLAANDMFPEVEGCDPWHSMMLTDLSGYLPDDILTKVDRTSMNVGLEARVPLLDHRIVEWSLSLPTSMKMRDGKSKWLLRQVLDRHLPSDIWSRRKRGFTVPVGAWLRGPLREWAEDLLSEDRLRQDGFFQVDPVRKAWQSHLQGGSDTGAWIWDLLMFQSWLDAR